MSTLDKLLTFISACLGALTVTDPIGLPQWVQVAAAVLIVGFAAIGIYTPNPVGNTAARGTRERTVKRGS